MAVKILTLDLLYPDKSVAKGTRITVAVDRDLSLIGTGVVARKGAVREFTITAAGDIPSIEVTPNDDPSLQDASKGYALIIEAEPTPAGGVTGGPWQVVVTSADDDVLSLGDLDFHNVVGLPPSISLGDTMARLTTVEGQAADAVTDAADAKSDAATALATAQATIAPTDNQVAVLADTASATRTSMRKSFAPYTLATDPTLGGGMSPTKTGAQNTTAWNAAMTALASPGGVLYVPAGRYPMGSGMNPVPGGVHVRGAGMDYSTDTTNVRGTCLLAAGTMDTMVVLGTTPSSSSSGVTSGTLSDIVVDGANLANIPVQTNARRNIVRNVYARNGLVTQFDILGQNGEFQGYNVAECGGSGDGIRVHAMPDNKIFEGLNVRGTPATTGAMIHLMLSGTGGSGSLASGHLKLHGCHAWTGADGVETASNALLWVDLTNGATFNTLDVLGNTFEGQIGPQIRLSVDATSSLSCVNVVGNVFFNGSHGTDVAWPAVLLEGAGPITSLNVVGNTVHGKDGNHRYLSILHDAGTGTRARVNVDGNVGTYVSYPVTQVAASLLQGVISMGANDVLATSSITRRTHMQGTWNATGDGTTSSWTIPQPLGMKIRHWMFTPRSAGIAVRPNWYSDTNTNGDITINFVNTSGAANPPANGASMWANWEATAVVQVVS